MTNNIQIGSNGDFMSKAKIKLYKDIFGEDPWNEGFRCQNCGSIYNRRFMGQCSCGQSDLIPFYRSEELKKGFSLQALQRGYQELIAKVLDEYIGFIWGWDTSLMQLNTDKLGLNEVQLEALIEIINDLFPDFDYSNFYYFAEIGVKNDYRGQDIAGELYRQNLLQVQKSGQRYILVRTTKKTDMPYRWFLKEGYQDIFSYDDKQDRVILILKI